MISEGGLLMEIQWFSKNLKGVVSIYETNITLNTVAASHFIDAYKVIIGYNSKNNTLIIKHLTKEDVLSSVFSNCEMHSISIKPSYGRINGKDIVKNISKYYPLDFQAKNLYKFECDWDASTKSLIIYLKGDNA